MIIPLCVEISTPQAVHGLVEHLGLRLTTLLEPALDNPEEYDGFIWGGETPGDDVGRYWIPAVWSIPALEKAVALLARGEGVSIASARQSMAQFHTGMQQDSICLLPWGYAEIDHLGVDEQVRRYSALSEATGLQWCLQVFTGGKSIHAYLAYESSPTPSDLRWGEIQRLLVVILEGDTRIVNPGRLMRLPGWAGADRPHPVLLYAPEHRYPIQEVLDRLRAYAASMGISDVAVAYRTLQIAEQLEVEARRETFTEVAMDLREHAARLRATRAHPDDADLRLADAMLGRGRMNAPLTTTNSGLGVAESHASEWVGLSKGRYNFCPWCGSSSSRVLSVIERNDGTLIATCFKENVTRCSAWASSGASTPVTDNEIDALFVSSEPTPEDREPQVEEWSPLTQADLIVAELEADRASAWDPDFISADVLDDDGVEVSVDGATPNIGRSDRSSLIEDPIRLERSLPVDDREQEAQAIFESLGGHPVWCASGPNLHASGVEEGVAKATRLSCNSYGCYTCGPRVLIALQAAAMVILRGYDREGGWVGSCIQGAGDDLRLALRRWHRGSPRERLYLGIAQNPGMVAYLVAWKGDEHRPKSWGALGQALGDADDIEGTLEGAVGALVAAVNLIEWGNHDGRAVILRGCSSIRGEVAELRDQVLGRTRTPRAAAPPEGSVAIRSYTPLSQVREMAEEMAQASTSVISEGDIDPRRRTISTTWGFEDSRIPAGGILSRLIEQGRVPPVRRRRRDEEELDSMVEVIE